MKPVFNFLVAATVVAASAVRQLNTSNWDSFILEHELSMVAFIKPSCQFCQELESEYDAAAAALMQLEGWPLARVNCEEDSGICRDFKVAIYPTILVFHGHEHSSYNGLRKARAIESFMRRHGQPVLTPLGSAASVREFQNKDDIVVVAYVDKTDAHMEEMMFNIAKKHRGKFLVGISSSETFGMAEGLKKPSIVVFKAFDEGKSVYSGDFQHDSIIQFLGRSTTPAIREIGTDLSSVGATTHIPSAFIFVDNETQQDKLVSSLNALAISTKDEIAWFIINPTKYPQYAPRVALSVGEWPAFAIEHGRNDFKYAFPQRGSTDALNPSAIGELLAAFKGGNLQSTIKSDPVPVDQKGTITTVVAKTYEDQVMQSARDVLLLYYSPTCKHCQAMAPEYEMLGALLSPYKDNIIISRIDATSNDVDLNPRSFPTLRLFKASSKGSPVTYAGNRSAIDMFHFVRENGSPGTTLALSASTNMHDEL